MKNTVSGTSSCLLTLVEAEAESEELGKWTSRREAFRTGLAPTCWRNPLATEAAAAPPQPPAPSVWPGSHPAGPASVPDLGSP